jgi:flagellar basal-body rod modification protein FlgD
MSSASAINTASDIQMDYMKILVTQLQYQDPLEPLDNNEMASQLAQFSQLQQLESMSSSFSDVLTNVERSYANSLIGKEISFAVETETGEREIRSAVVEEVYYDVEGQIVLATAEYTLGLEDVISVKN